MTRLRTLSVLLNVIAITKNEFYRMQKDVIFAQFEATAPDWRNRKLIKTLSRDGRTPG
jgi:hypothetical protein